MAKWSSNERSAGALGRARLLLAGSIALALVFAYGVSSVRATVMVEVPMERLVADADAIVFARVARSDTRLVIDEHGAAPHTFATLEVIEALRGVVPERVRVDEIGGEIQGRGSWIAGTPRYTVGEECVVFLRALPDGTFRTYAMAQGHFIVRPGAPGVASRVIRDTSAVGLVTWSRDAMQLAEGGVVSMPLDAFLAYVRQLVANTEASR